MNFSLFITFYTDPRDIFIIAGLVIIFFHFLIMIFFKRIGVILYYIIVSSIEKQKDGTWNIGEM